VDAELLDIRRVGGTDPVARVLLAAMEGWVADGYGPVEPGRTSVVAPEEMEPPDGHYVVVAVSGEPVAGGGVRRLTEEIVEVKRMYVEPRFRGGGLGRRLLAELEAAARDLGYRRARLDTAGWMEAFYRSAGYVPIPDYNGNGYATFWGEKALS
jgi:GNAT superfamily N-acetyltransferase